MKKLILILVLICGNAWAVEDINPIPESSELHESNNQVNEELRKVSRRISRAENNVNLDGTITGIVPIENGGTGQDFSAVAQGNIPFFSATGVMGNIGIGTTGYYLSSNGTIPVYIPPVEQDLTLVSATTFSAEASKTITGLTTGTPYLLVLDLAQVANNNELVLYPNGTLASIESTANYAETSGSFRMNISANGAGFGAGSIGSWQIRFRTLQGDTTKTAIILDGFDTGTDTRHSAYALIDSDTALSSITIAGQGGTMTLTGTAYLYKYSIS